MTKKRVKLVISIQGITTKADKLSLDAKTGFNSIFQDQFQYFQGLRKTAIPVIIVLRPVKLKK